MRDVRQSSLTRRRQLIVDRAIADVTDHAQPNLRPALAPCSRGYEDKARSAESCAFRAPQVGGSERVAEDPSHRLATVVFGPCEMRQGEGCLRDAVGRAVRGWRIAMSAKHRLTKIHTAAEAIGAHADSPIVQGRRVFKKKHGQKESGHWQKERPGWALMTGVIGIVKVPCRWSTRSSSSTWILLWRLRQARRMGP